MTLAPESREIIAFSTPTDHFEWLRMPFGLKSAPITFERMTNTLFADMLGKDVYPYLDDLIICSKNGDTHLADLEAVLHTLKDAVLKAKLTKFFFFFFFFFVQAYGACRLFLRGLDGGRPQPVVAQAGVL